MGGTSSLRVRETINGILGTTVLKWPDGGEVLGLDGVLGGEWSRVVASWIRGRTGEGGWLWCDISIT